MLVFFRVSLSYWLPMDRIKHDFIQYIRGMKKVLLLGRDSITHNDWTNCSFLDCYSELKFGLKALFTPVFDLKYNKGDPPVSRVKWIRNALLFVCTVVWYYKMVLEKKITCMNYFGRYSQSSFERCLYCLPPLQDKSVFSVACL